MADTPIFTLDAKDHWRLAYDDLQWILQRRHGKPRARSSGYAGVSFIATYKRILLDVMREKGVDLTSEAAAKLDALPDTFKEFRSALRHADAPKEGARKARKAVLGTRTAKTPVPALCPA